MYDDDFALQREVIDVAIEPRPAIGCPECSGKRFNIERYISSIDRFMRVTRLDDLSDAHVHACCDELFFESKNYSGVLIRRDSFILAFLKRNMSEENASVDVLVELYNDGADLENVFSVYERGDSEVVAAKQASWVMQLAYELENSDYHSIYDTFSDDDVSFSQDTIDIKVKGASHHFPRPNCTMSRYVAYSCLKDIGPVLEYVEGNGFDSAQTTILKGVLSDCKKRCYEAVHTGNFDHIDFEDPYDDYDDHEEPRDVFPPPLR